MKNKNIYKILVKMMYKYGKYGEKKHGSYLHIFSKDKKKCLKLDTYNGVFQFGRVSEKIEKRYDKFNKRFIYGNNHFTGVRIIIKFYLGEPERERELKEYINNGVNLYKFILKNT